MAIVGFGAGAAAAAGSPRWTRPVVIARGTCRVAPSSLAVAQNDRGNALVAWLESCGSDWRVVMSSRSPSRRFHPPSILSVTRAPLVTPHIEIALDAHGGATVVWTRERFGVLSPGSTVLVSTRKPGRRFGRPQILDRDGIRPALAGNARGEAIVVWQHVSPQGNVARTGSVAAAVRAAGASRFGSSQTLSAPLAQPQNQYTAFPADASPAVSLASNGGASASWTRTDGTAANCCTAVEAAVRTPGGPFGPPHRVSPAVSDISDWEATTAISDRGDAVVAWTTRRTFPDFSPNGMFAAEGNGQGFGPPIPLMRSEDVSRGTRFFDLGILLSRDGTPTVHWGEDPFDCSGTRRRVAVTLRSGAAPSQTLLAPTDGTIQDFTTALDAEDRIIAVWIRRSGQSTDRYGACYGGRYSGGTSIEGGPTLATPIERGEDLALATVASRPLLAWSVGNRILVSTLTGIS
jgi:hypothetical protein